MHHFFTTPEEIGEEYIRITGPDVNHIRNVLRMKLGREKITAVNWQNLVKVRFLLKSRMRNTRAQSRYVNFIYFRDFRSQIRWN